MFCARGAAVFACWAPSAPSPQVSLLYPPFHHAHYTLEVVCGCRVFWALREWIGGCRFCLKGSSTPRCGGSIRCEPVRVCGCWLGFGFRWDRDSLCVVLSCATFPSLHTHNRVPVVAQECADRLEIVFLWVGGPCVAVPHIPPLVFLCFFWIPCSHHPRVCIAELRVAACMVFQLLATILRRSCTLLIVYLRCVVPSVFWSVLCRLWLPPSLPVITPPAAPS